MLNLQKLKTNMHNYYKRKNHATWVFSFHPYKKTKLIDSFFHQTDSDQPLFYRANSQPCNSCFYDGRIARVSTLINASAKCLNEKSKVTNREQNRNEQMFSKSIFNILIFSELNFFWRYSFKENYWLIDF